MGTPGAMSSMWVPPGDRRDCDASRPMVGFGRHTGAVRRRFGFAAGEISQPWILDKWSILPVATPRAVCTMLLPPKVRRERDTRRPVAEFGLQEGTAHHCDAL